MFYDLSTVLYKDLLESLQALRRPTAVLGLLVQLTFFSIFPVLVAGPAASHSPLLLAFWLLVPTIVAIGTATSAFAGERERHTLETLLATRLSDRAILFGKLAFSVVMSSMYMFLTMLMGLLPLNLAFGSGSLRLYTPALVLGGLLLGTLLASVIAAAGVLVSLRSATKREADQRLSTVMFVLFFPFFGLNLVPLDQRIVLIESINQVPIGMIIAIASGILTLLMGILLTLVMRRFRRAQLVLDTASATHRQQHAVQQAATGPLRQEQQRQATPAPGLLSDVQTVIWKEWRELLHGGTSKKSSAATLLVVAVTLFGIMFPLQWGRAWITNGGALVSWMLVPMMVLLQTIAESFAGERERHTLETVLATRLPDQAIWLGKLVAPLLWAWGITQVLIGISMATVNIMFGAGTLLIFPLPIAAAGMGFGLLLGAFAATSGALLSLRAATVRQAQQQMAAVFIGLGVAYVLLTVLAVWLLQRMGSNPANLIEHVPGALVLWTAGVLTAIDLVLLIAGMRRFRRSRLLLV